MSEDELTHCQDKLAQVKKDYDEFVYQVSHDLKAPIRGINNLAEWITEDLGDSIPADVKHKLDLLCNRSHHLEHMLAAILELSRVSRTHLQIEAIALSPFLHEIKESFSLTKATFSIPADLPLFSTYAVKLRTVIHQLFDNAIKHNPGKAVHITVTGQTQSNYIKLIVADNGAGIPPEGADKIFNIFYTGQIKKDSNSIGAGLTISKKIADFVGGNLYLEKNTLAGCTFILNWPFKIIQKP